MGLKKLARTLTGKKTNIAAVGAIAGAALGVATGRISTAQALQFGLTSILAMTLRDGMKRAREDELAAAA